MVTDLDGPRNISSPERPTHRWVLPDDAVPHRLRDMGRTLGERYGHDFTQIGVNLYRDGADGVAWHGDRVARERPEAVVALVDGRVDRHRGRDDERPQRILERARHS